MSNVTMRTDANKINCELSPRSFFLGNIKTVLTLHNCLIHARTFTIPFSYAISFALFRQNGLQTRCFEGTPLSTFVTSNGRSVHIQGRN